MRPKLLPDLASSTLSLALARKLRCPLVMHWRVSAPANALRVAYNAEILEANQTALESNDRMLKSNADMMGSNNDLLLALAAKPGIAA